MPSPLGCHLVGSVPLPDTETALRVCATGLPNRLKRLPDGETGRRNLFTLFQSAIFTPSPEMNTIFLMNSQIPSETAFTDTEIAAGVQKLKDAGPMITGYDDAAIESYQSFKKLKQQGIIHPLTKFQVSLPTPANVITPFVQAVFQAAVEPLYEAALFRAMERIQAEIPHEELAIQIDLAVDTAFWEDGVDIYRPWFGEGDATKEREYIVEYIRRMVGQVEEGVEVGLHNCYGRSSLLLMPFDDVNQAPLTKIRRHATPSLARTIRPLRHHTTHSRPPPLAFPPSKLLPRPRPKIRPPVSPRLSQPANRLATILQSEQHGFLSGVCA